jgi:SAM-dependent methyltransferase
MLFFSFERLALELEDIQQDLEGLPPIKPDCRIGDFACGSGYATLCLMLEYHAIDCFGIDNSKSWQLPSIPQLQNDSDIVNDNDVPTNDISKKVKQLLDEGRWPIFRQADILDVHHLPTDIDLVYCKRLLHSIYMEEYDNSPNGEEGVIRAIDNMVGCLRPNGLLCLVEKPGINFTAYLERANLTFLRIHGFRRLEIKGNQRLDTPAKGLDFVVYHARKC